jgi:hypothetical protein
MCHGLKLHLSCVNSGRTQKHQQIIFAVLFRELFNSTLNLKVHSACGGSNKALRCGIYDFRAEPIDSLLDGVAWDAIALAKDCNFFSVNVHEGPFCVVMPLTSSSGMPFQHDRHTVT